MSGGQGGRRCRPGRARVPTRPPGSPGAPCRSEFQGGDSFGLAVGFLRSEAADRLGQCGFRGDRRRGPDVRGRRRSVRRGSTAREGPMAQATATTEARAPFGEGRPSRAGPRELAQVAVAGKGRGRGRGGGRAGGSCVGRRQGRDSAVCFPVSSVKREPRSVVERARRGSAVRVRGAAPASGREGERDRKTGCPMTPGVRQGAPDRSEDPGSQGSSQGSSGGRDSCTGSGSIAGRGHRCQRRSRKPPDTTRAAGGLGTSAFDRRAGGKHSRPQRHETRGAPVRTPPTPASHVHLPDAP